MLLYPNGDKYVGLHLDNNKHGLGVMTFKNGTKYDGSWLNGKPHGEGVFTTTSGSLRGRWENG